MWNLYLLLIYRRLQNYFVGHEISAIARTARRGTRAPPVFGEPFGVRTIDSAHQSSARSRGALSVWPRAVRTAERRRWLKVDSNLTLALRPFSAEFSLCWAGKPGCRISQIRNNRPSAEGQAAVQYAIDGANNLTRLKKLELESETRARSGPDCVVVWVHPIENQSRPASLSTGNAR